MIPDLGGITQANSRLSWKQAGNRITSFYQTTWNYS
jgi:hypothetical protein